MNLQAASFEPDLRTATLSDRESGLETITLGFVTDPVARWIWPELGAYMQAMPIFAGAFAGKAFELGTADLAGGFRAASLWLPPGAVADADTIDSLFESTVRAEIASELDEMFAQMDAFHPSADACWYLPMIAVDPGFVGRGLGGWLLKQGLQRCDQAGQIAYLESSNIRNLGLYERHGFELIGEIQAGSSPKMFPMVRQPLRS